MSFRNSLSWCRVPLLAMAILCGTAALAAGGDGERFHRPTNSDGYRIDHCLYWAADCDRPAANEFCRARGFRKAVDWELESVSPTFVMGDGSICEGSHCIGFRYIRCGGYR